MSRGWRDTTHRRDARVCGERGCPTGSGQHQHGLRSPAPRSRRSSMRPEILTTWLARQRRVRRKTSSRPQAACASGSPGFTVPRRFRVPYAMVSKFDPSGEEVWGAELGGPAASNLTGASSTALAVAANGNVAFTGSTGGQFPTTPGAAIGSSTSATAFAAMVSADGSKFLYSTYLPDSVAASSSIAVDAAGNAYIAGQTSSGHAFVLKLSADGSTIVYNATLAGSGADAATAITVDPAGNAYVTGQTTSPDFPVTAGAFQQHLKGTRNSFLATLDPSGNVLTSTYFGGSGWTVRRRSRWIARAISIWRDPPVHWICPTTPGSHATVHDRAPVEQLLARRLRGAVRPGRHFVEVGELCDEPISVSTNGANLDVGVSALGVGPAGDIYLGGADRPRISGDTFGSFDLLPGLDQPHQRLPGSPELKRCAPRCNLSGDQRRRAMSDRWGIVAASRRQCVIAWHGPMASSPSPVWERRLDGASLPFQRRAQLRHARR